MRSFGTSRALFFSACRSEALASTVGIPSEEPRRLRLAAELIYAEQIELLEVSEGQKELLVDELVQTKLELP